MQVSLVLYTLRDDYFIIAVDLPFLLHFLPAWRVCVKNVNNTILLKKKKFIKKKDVKSFTIGRFFFY